MTLFKGHPLIRSRTKLIRKGRQLRNPSQEQFSIAFTWFYKNKDKFEKLNSMCDSVSVYGEWMVQQHGMVYDRLPDWFVAFDVYDWSVGKFFDPQKAYQHLKEAGFAAIQPTRYNLKSPDSLESLANMPSDFANAKREGIYLKISDESWVTQRFKMVRQGFDQGCLLGDTIKKNVLK